MYVPRNLIEIMWPLAGKKMIFLHAPKCGGSFVAQHFGFRITRCPTRRWPEARGHLTYLEYQKVFQDRGQNIHDYTIFTVIRNPWDWHVSWYNYLSKDINGKRSGMPLEHAQIKNLSFSEYLNWLGDKNIQPSANNYCRKQVCDWLIDDTGQIRADEVLRQENLVSDLEALKKNYNLNLKSTSNKRINASRSDRCYRKYYTDLDAEFISQRHSRDIKLFNYKF